MTKYSLNYLIEFFLGGVVEHPVTDVTPTMLTPNVISTLRQADHLANQVLNANQESKNNLSQMPLVLIPIHFDRYEYLLSQFKIWTFWPFISCQSYQGSHQNLQISHFQIHVCQKINLIILQMTFFLEYWIGEQFLLCIALFRV